MSVKDPVIRVSRSTQKSISCMFFQSQSLRLLSTPSRTMAFAAAFPVRTFYKTPTLASSGKSAKKAAANVRRPPPSAPLIIVSPGPHTAGFSLKGGSKSNPYALPSVTTRTGSSTLGCTPEFFRAWTEFQMLDTEFGWENRNSVWTYDHVVPVSSTNAHDKTSVLHWSNVRPYNARANSSKGSRRDHDDEFKHLLNLQHFLASHWTDLAPPPYLAPPLRRHTRANPPPSADC